MGSISSSGNTPYQGLISSKPAQFAKEHPVIASGGVIATGVLVNEAAKKSELATTLLRKGAAPALGAGAMALGVAMTHDAVTNETKDKRDRFYQGAIGTAVTVGGAEVLGQSAFKVSPTKAVVETAGKIIPKGLLHGTLAATPGLLAVGWGAHDMSKNGITLGNTAAVSLGSLQAGFYGTQIGMQNVASPLAHKVAEKGMGVVATGAFGLGAYALGKEAIEGIKEGNYLKAGATAAGATAAGLAGVHTLSLTLGTPGLGAIGRAAVKNPVIAGSLTMLAVSAGAYAVYQAKN